MFYVIENLYINRKTNSIFHIHFFPDERLGRLFGYHVYFFRDLDWPFHWTQSTRNETNERLFQDQMLCQCVANRSTILSDENVSRFMRLNKRILLFIHPVANGVC